MVKEIILNCIKVIKNAVGWINFLHTMKLWIKNIITCVGSTKSFKSNE